VHTSTAPTSSTLTSEPDFEMNTPCTPSRISSAPATVATSAPALTATRRSQ